MQRHALLLLLPLLLAFAGCTTLPDEVTRTPSYHLDDASGTRLYGEIQPMVAAHPELSGFHVMPQGADAFANRLALIESAQRTIDAQYYIWHDDLTGGTLFARLLAAADRGVRVRLLLDDLNTGGMDPVLRALDAHPQIEVRLFNPFGARQHRLADMVADPVRINHRMHNKTLTADNTATIFGGRNVGDEYFGAAEEVGFSDMDALAVGPIVGEVSAQFDKYWNSEYVYPLAAFFDEPLPEAEVAAYRERAAQDLEEARQSDYAEIVARMDVPSGMGLGDLDYGWSKWFLAYDEPGKMDTEEVGEGTHLAPKLKLGMDATQRELIIVSPYFVPGEDFTRYLVSLVDRGVVVRILTNSLAANDVGMVHAGYMRYRKELVRGGVELYEYRTTRDMGQDTADRASLHAKFFGFDRRFIFVGSYNLDGRSTYLNTELGAYFEDVAQASRLSGFFDTSLIQNAYRVSLDDKGDLAWTTVDDGVKRVEYEEPDTTFWQRLSTQIASWVVPEKQL